MKKLKTKLCCILSVLFIVPAAHSSSIFSEINKGIENIDLSSVDNMVVRKGVKNAAKNIEKVSNSDISTAEKSAEINRELVRINEPQLIEPQINSLKRYSPKIIGGNSVAYRQYPWQVALIRNSPPFRQFCGGSVIAPNWILTAAHCVDGGTFPTDLLVLVGTDHLDSGKRIEVDKIIKHENYVNPVTSGFDVALIKLKEPTSEVPISLIDPDEERELAHSGTFAWVTGWGITELGLPSIQLKEVDVRIIHEEECNSSKMYDGVVTDTMICAGYRIGGKDSCQGDSGGPLMVVNRKGGLKQVGVVSWGEGCAEENRPGVYTRLAVLRDWIESKQLAGEQIGMLQR